MRILQVLLPNLVLLFLPQVTGLMLGHELLHKPKISRAWYWLVLMQNGYLVYAWEHVHHHKKAGSLTLDMASTPRHCSVYRFLATRYPTHIQNAARNVSLLPS